MAASGKLSAFSLSSLLGPGIDLEIHLAFAVFAIALIVRQVDPIRDRHSTADASYDHDPHSFLLVAG